MSEKNTKKVTRGTASRQSREMVVFAMLASLMLATQLAMSALPNVHLVGVLTIVYTLVYRYKALIPIYVYVILYGVISGFATWWVPYLYVWTLLWGVVVLLPKKMPRGVKLVLYPTLCLLHGMAFGTLFAPVWALLHRLTFKEMLAWIAAGFGFDLVHAFGNLALGLLIYPLSELLFRLTRKYLSK